MGNELDELAARGRAAERAQHAAQDERERKRDVALRTETARRLSWGANPIVFGAFWLGGLAWLVSIAMNWPYFNYALTGNKAHGQTWAYDPAKAGHAFLPVFLAASAVFALGIVLRVVSGSVGRRRVAAETAWAASRPFPVIGYPSVIGRNWNWYEFKIAFGGTIDTTSTRFADILRGIDRAIQTTVEPREAKIKILYPRNSTVAHNTHALVSAFHRIVDEVLVPERAANPVASVTFE